MRTRISIEAYAARLLAVLSLGPLAAAAGCDGAEDDEAGPGVECVNPQPVVAGQDTGFLRCESGALHRPAALACPNALPREGTTCPADLGGCTLDTECTEKPNGMCHNGGFDGGCSCSYGCTTDAECGDGQICVCGEFIGHCVQADDCTTDADCNGGLCTTYDDEPGCGQTVFACSTASDECGGDGDCPEGEQCTMEGGHRVCVDPQCAIGRPFLVAGSERLADAKPRADWCASDLRPEVTHLSHDERAVLCDHWTRAARMEHASVAAFARFVLQLLSQGAPPELVDAAQAAMRDETEHARLCFALASAYGGSPVGPGPLPLEGALDDQDARAILVGTILEGCVGETVAAIEAAEAAAHATDPAVRAVLARIAEDETRHAELAWRYVAWALASGSRDLVDVARRTFAAAMQTSHHAEAEPRDRSLRWLRLGRTTDEVRARLRREALERVIAPCATRLLAARQTAAVLTSEAQS